MNVLSPRNHAAIDYMTIVLFAVAPLVLGLDGAAATISYVLAAAHAAVTLATPPPVGFLRLLPMRLHGGIEVVVGALLVAGPWLLGDTFDGNDRTFFTVVGLVILAVWVVTHYPSREATDPSAHPEV